MLSKVPPCTRPTGAWENQGLGIVKAVGEELVWTYTASHLGHWIAAPLPSSSGTHTSSAQHSHRQCFMSLKVSVFIWQDVDSPLTLCPTTRTC